MQPLFVVDPHPFIRIGLPGSTFAEPEYPHNITFTFKLSTSLFKNAAT